MREEIGERSRTVGTLMSASTERGRTMEVVKAHPYFRLKEG